MGQVSAYREVLTRFAARPIVTIATGTTCAYLGDERNLREFLVADEAAKVLRKHGHTVFSLLIDDSYDPLNYRQLRVAVDKDERMIKAYEHYCGRPIAHVPDPWGCHSSLAAHFEHALLARLSHLGAHPTIVSTANLYEKGVYRPYIEEILHRLDEIRDYLSTRFPEYTPRKLVWVLCPKCGYIDCTDIQKVSASEVSIHCSRCDKSQDIPLAEVQAKLNWKLDCALRWKIFDVAAEPFNKAYLEPKTGAYTVAQQLSTKFFNGPDVMPLQYGMVYFDNSLSYRLLESLPAPMLRHMLVDRPASDIKINRDRIMVEASRYEAMPGISYLDMVKQLLPAWMMTPDTLSVQERELLTQGVAFSRTFLESPLRLKMPSPRQFTGERREVMDTVHRFVVSMIILRQVYADFDSFAGPAKRLVNSLGDHRKAVMHRLRLIVGQENGPTMIRFLFSIPLDYVMVLEYMLRKHLETTAPKPIPSHAVVSIPTGGMVNAGAYIN